MEAIVTETQDEDLNKPATIGTVRMLAVHADAGFAQLHMDLERLNDKVDHLDENLSQRIGGVETNLSQRIDSVEDNLSQRIGGVESKLTQRIDSVEDKLTQRIDSVEDKLTQRIDHLDEKLSQRIDSVEDKLTQRIDHLDEKLSQRIDNSVIELKSEMSVNLSTVMDQLALRTNSDRFIKTGFGVAVLGVLIQTVFVAVR